MLSEVKALSEVSFLTFSQPKKMKCECCDRSTFIEVKMFVAREGRLVGDLELCSSCAELLQQAVARENVVREWDFSSGGESLG
ncbi:hypothetical protein [Zhaonella formicivorans]|uniref:hypothetical protein n=1 Tax=Zhaonella formicivorans TaxID=2528593 RepID=UPI001D11625F|nr:hypothetical protein [Zhaonella formicivorans]